MRMLLSGRTSRAATAAVMGILSAGVALGQTPVLPATSPTAADRSVSQLSSARPVAGAVPSHLEVLWDGVQLQVEATNVPLSGVLREVSRKTGLHITGGAPEERIFGSYGPGPMNTVVPALLEGLPVNVLLTQHLADKKDELLLTAREGGPTPSSVPTQQDQAVAEAPPPAALPTNAPGYRPGFNPGGRGQFGPGSRGQGQQVGNFPPDNTLATPGDNGVNGASTNGINGAGSNGINGSDNGISVPATGGSSTAAGTDANGTPVSPNGVRSPQEIFDQLQRLRTQQAQPQ